MNKSFTTKPSATDWERVRKLRDADIDLTDNPEASAEMFARTVVRRGLAVIPGKKQAPLRLKADDLDSAGSQEN